MIDEAHSAILAEFELMLPKELKPIKIKVGKLKLTRVDGYTMGYNQCLSDIKAKLAQEKANTKEEGR